MGYKMKKPSVHSGTTAHRTALKLKSIEARKAELKAAGASSTGGESTTAGILSGDSGSPTSYKKASALKHSQWEGNPVDKHDHPHGPPAGSGLPQGSYDEDGNPVDSKTENKTENKTEKVVKKEGKAYGGTKTWSKAQEESGGKKGDPKTGLNKTTNEQRAYEKKMKKANKNWNKREDNEWKKRQNTINKALGSKVEYKVEEEKTVVPVEKTVVPVEKTKVETIKEEGTKEREKIISKGEDKAGKKIAKNPELGDLSDLGALGIYKTEKKSIKSQQKEDKKISKRKKKIAKATYGRGSEEHKKSKSEHKELKKGQERQRRQEKKDIKANKAQQKYERTGKDKHKTKADKLSGKAEKFATKEDYKRTLNPFD